MTPVQSLLLKVREWFAEVQRRVDTGGDPFQEAKGGRAADGDGDEAQAEASTAGEERSGAGMGDDNEEEDDGEETDDSEVWEPSRSVRKSLSVSED